MKVAIVGGGINGIMIAWELARQGCEVVLFERAGLMQATSAASSKMLHGGIRYLEQGHFRLVRESLQERAWWLARAPKSLAGPLALLIPVFENGPRGRWILGAGVKLYDWLARGSGFPVSRWLSHAEVLKRFPTLIADGLIGAWEYWDAQMDDQMLGLWAADQATQAGVDFRTNSRVSRVSAEGALVVNNTEICFDRVVNATGPWAKHLLDESKIKSDFELSLVRGSHLLIDKTVPCGCVLQRKDDGRVVFVLPWGNKALLGTTEVVQETPDTQPPSQMEIDYLLETYNHFFSEPLAEKDVLSMFAGVRPLLRSSGSISRSSRESAVEHKGRLTTVFGGKWTSSHSLANVVAQSVLQ